MRHFTGSGVYGDPSLNQNLPIPMLTPLKFGREGKNHKFDLHEYTLRYLLSVQT